MKNLLQKYGEEFTRVISMILFVFLMSPANISAQNQTTEIKALNPDQTIEREMTGVETHRYQFDLKANEFFQVRVEQKGVDVALKLIDSGGKTLATMDSPNSKEGPETLSFAASTAGTYTLEVSGFDVKAEKGNYTISRVASRAANANDKRRVAIEKLLVEGMTAREAEGQGEIAITKLETALQGWRELNDNYLVELTAKQINRLKKTKADAIKNEAFASFKQGTAESYKTALEKFQAANRIYKEIFDKSENAGISLLFSGGIFDKLGEKSAALKYYDQALAMFRAIDDKSFEATTLNNIGTVYDSLGEKQKALDYFAQALPLKKAVSDKRNEANILNNIGGVYDALGEKQKALDYYNQSLRLLKAVGDKSGEANALNNIGMVYNSLDEKQKALDYYAQALPLFKAVGDKSGEAATLNNIGGVYDALGEKQKALDYYNQSLPLVKVVDDKSGEATTLSNEMFVWKALNNGKLAIFYGKQSVNIYQQLRANIKGLDRGVQQTYLQSIEYTYRSLAGILIADSRLPEGQAVLDLIKEEEFSGLLRRSGNAETSVPYSQAETAALGVLERVAALGREKGELDEKNKSDSLTDAEKQRYLEINKQIEITEAEFNKSLAALSAEKNKGQNFDVVAADAQAFMDDLKNLGKGAVALYTVVVNDSKPIIDNGKPAAGVKEPIKTGWIILVTPEFRKAYPIDVKDLEQTVFAFRAALSSPRYDPQPLAMELYKKLFLQTSEQQKTTLAADLDEYFKGKTDRTLMWSLDGVLRYVPMAALHDGSGYLVEKYRNTIFTTASKGRLNADVKPKWTVLGLGVSVGREESGKSFPALAGAKRELQTIVRGKDNPGIMSGSIELDDQFTQDAMQNAILFDKNPVVHIASHFSYQPADFDQSFLLLGKGKLTVKDFTAKSGLFSNVDLLTLSACETAVGGANGKDVEGFAYVAQSLGAKAVMATLWQVDDIGTQVLMPEFYRLHETGIGKGEALRQAQLALLQGKIKDVPSDLKRAEVVGATDNNQFKLSPYNKEGKPPFAHPFYWSPFVLIGNWK